MKITKQKRIKGLLSLNPKLSAKYISNKIGCSKRLVRMVRVKIEDEATKVDSIVGIIADTHEPATHSNYFEFIKKTFKRFSVTQVVHIGDVVEHSKISRHVSDPAIDDAVTEFEKTKKAMKRWTDEFPEVSVCVGNHDAIPARQAKELGIPKQFLRSLNNMYDLPESWIFKDHHVIDGVWYEHGLGSSGLYGMRNTALKMRCSYVMGHTHKGGGVLYMSGPTDTIFGLNCGCGVDADHKLMKYGKNFKEKVTLGCGIVINGKEAMFIPMT